MPWENTGSGTSASATARPGTGARTGVWLTVDSLVRCLACFQPRSKHACAPQGRLLWSRLPLSSPREVTAYERDDESRRDIGKVGPAHSRLRTVAATRQEPHAADRRAARGRHPVA